MIANGSLTAGLSPQVSRSSSILLPGIIIVAVALATAIGLALLSDLIERAAGVAVRIDRTLVVALLLNIALVLIGWSRQRALTAAIERRGVAEERVERLTTRDALTGLLNRRTFAEQGAAALAQVRRRGNVQAVVMIGLHRFSSVNALHGHEAGDALLATIAADLGEAMPEGAVLGRWGDHEFACALPIEGAYPGAVDRLAERLLGRLARPIDVGATTIHVAAAIGLARADDERRSFEALVHAASLAMHAARRRGRHGILWFDRSMEDELRARNELERGLREAIADGAIVPYFEQQIDFETGEVTGFEVLARWERRGGGLVSPERFIPIAEETGLIADLSLGIMKRAFEAARDWDPAITLSVNISPVQLRDPWLPQKLIKLLTETGFPASRLEVEITESALMENLALARTIVSSLKNQGIRLALDDFGTGYSSLAHLRALPFDRIKIDKSFVTSMNDNAESAAIVTAVARLAESLNLPVTAEGIEDKAVAGRLATLGCTKGQGYFYGRPMNAAQTRRLLAERHRLVTPSRTNGTHPTTRRLAG